MNKNVAFIVLIIDIEWYERLHCDIIACL